MLTGASAPDLAVVQPSGFTRFLRTRLAGATALLGLLMTIAACASAGGGDGPPRGDPTGQCAERLSSDITVARTLSNVAGGCDYLVEGELRVHGALTIEPGTEVRFAQDARLTFSNSGSLNAVGTAAERIVLRGQTNQHGSWYGLCFSDADASRVEHVDLMNAGKVLTGGSLTCRGAIGSVGNFTSAPVSIVDSHVSGARTSGLDAARLPLGDFARNIFSDNLEYGVRVSPANASHLDVDTDYSGVTVDAPNGRPFVYLAGRLNEPGSTHTWRDLNAPYLTGGDENPYSEYVTVDDATHVVVELGTTFYFREGGGITIDRGSTFTAIGTEAKPVVFTGVEEAPGSWLGLLTRDAAVHLERAEVSWAGADRGEYAGNVLITGVRTSQMSYVGRSSIQGSASCGLYANSNTVDFLEIEDNDYADNAQNECLP